MSKLNGDIHYLILKELQDDKKSLRSCLLVNRTWCKITIPILWKNPWKFFVKTRGYRKNPSLRLLLKVIILHLSSESREKLKVHRINFLRNSYQKPLFDYINFCK